MKAWRTVLQRAICVGVAFVAVTACASNNDPSGGTFTVEFPSTAAAIATDYVQVLVFDVKSPTQRAGLCQELITARLTSPASLAPSIPPVVQNICEILNGKKPLTSPYGEHAVVAIAQRTDGNNQIQDFMIGCAIMTIGDGDAPLPIPLKLVSVRVGVPATTCSSVSERCRPGNSC